jgi:hypothetical protein
MRVFGVGRNLSHLRRCEILVGDPTQRLPFGFAQGRRAGLTSAAPPALGKEDLGNGSAFLARKSEGKAKRADLKDQRYIEECRKGKAHRQECLCHWG